MPKNYNLHLKGYVGHWDFSADMVSYILDRNKDGKVCVLIDSLGGRVDAALSISSLFKAHGNVHCHYVGMNASAATIASMGAKHISIDSHALYLVHKCMCTVFEWDVMNADELAAHIEELQKMKKDNDTIDHVIAGLYAARCKKDRESLLALMKEGAWLTAQQALEWGFVDEITNDQEDTAPVMTDVVADFMAKEGIPMPSNLEVKKGSFLERLVQFFSPNSKPATEDAPPEASVTNHQTMAKVFTKLAALLGCAVALADEKITLTEAQADSIENALASHETKVTDLESQIAAKDARITELEAQVADLSKEPADDTRGAKPAGDTKVDDLDQEKLVDALLKNI